MIQKVYGGRSPVGEVILVSRAAIRRIGLMSSRADNTSVNIANIANMADDHSSERETISVAYAHIGFYV